MSSRLKLRGLQKRRSGKPYERKSVLEKVKEFFTPSYWLGGEETMQDDASTQTMNTGDETGHNFHPSYSHSAGSSHTSQTTQSDVVVVDDKQNEKPIPGSSVSKKNESSQAWKKNMISLNEDMETGPSRLFQNEVGGSRITASESATVNALHNTKLFIPASLSSPQHSTPLKNNDRVSTVSESGPIKTSVSNERDVLSEQQESSAAEVRKESTTSSASAVHQLELQPSGSMLTPPDSPTLESHSVGNRTRTQSHNSTRIMSPVRFNIPHGQGPLRSPYYSGRTTFGGASSQVKIRTVKRRRVSDSQTSPELPPVRQQLHARPGNHQTVVASQTAKQILESLKNYSTPVSNAKRFPVRSPVTPLMSPKESVVPAAKRHRTKATTSTDTQHEEVSGPPVNPLVTPFKAHIMTLPLVTPPIDDRLHSNPIAMTTTGQSTSTHSSEPHPLSATATMSATTSSELSNTQQGSNKFWTNELARVKEKSQDMNQPVTEGFATGWVGGAGSKGKIKEKKHSKHESLRVDDEQINPMEMPEAVPLQLSSSGKLPSFSFTPAFLQKKDDTGGAASKETDTFNVPSTTTGGSSPYNFSQPKAIMTGMKSTASKEPVTFSFSTPRQHSTEAETVVSAIPAISLPMHSVPPKISFSSQLKLLPSTQPLLLSGSAAAGMGSERKPLPLKSGSCLEILKPSKPPVEEQVVKRDSQSKHVSTSDSSMLSLKFKPAEGSLECPTSLISNKSTDDKCAASVTSRPGSAPTAGVATATCSVVTSTSLTPFQSMLSQKFKPAEGLWECPTCMISNKSTDDKCAACATSRPGNAPTTATTATGVLSTSSTSDKGMTLAAGGGLQLGSSGGLKLAAMKDSGELKVSNSGGLKLGPSGGLQLGPGGGLQLGNLKSDSGTGNESARDGFKLGSSGGFKLGPGGDLKLGSSSDLKLAPGSDTKLGIGNRNLNLESGGGLKLGSNSSLQMTSTQSSNLPTNVIVTTVITSNFTSSSHTTQSLSTKFKPAEGSWECPTCMISNKSTDDKCVACTTSRPGGASSSTEGSTSLLMPGSGSKSGVSGGLQLGSLNNQNLSSTSDKSSGDDSSRPVLLSGQQSLSSSTQFGIKSSDTAAGADNSSGLQIGSSSTGIGSTGGLQLGSSGGLQLGSSGGPQLGSSGGLQLGSSGGLQLGSSGGLQLGTSSGLQLGAGGLQSDSSSGGFKLGQLTNIQPASGEGIKLTNEAASMTDNLGGIKLPLVGQKRSHGHTESETGSTEGPTIGNKSQWMGLTPLNKPVTTAKSVTFKLDGNNNTNTDVTSNTRQASFGITQPSLVGVGGGVLTSTGFTLTGSLTNSGDNKLPAASNPSTVKPFANLFSQSSTTNPNVLNFAFAKSTSASATTTGSTLLNAPLSFNAGISSTTLVTATSSADPPKLFNFSQQSLFTAGGQGQQLPSSGLDLKLPTCQDKKEISGNVTFNFSGAKSSELSSQGQQGMSAGLGLTQLNSQQATTQPGFNFHAALQNQGGSIFTPNLGSGLTSTSAANSTLFIGQPMGLGTNQVNASGMEISNPATGEPQHLPNLAAPGGQGLQLQFGSNNSTQPFMFNQPDTTQQGQSMFEGNSSNLFGVNNPVLGGDLPANMTFSATPSIANRPIKKARRRINNNRP